MMLLPIYRTAFNGGLAQGLMVTFTGCLIAIFFTSSVIATIIVVLSLAILGGAITALARLFSEREEWGELDKSSVQAAFDKEQHILTRIGIPQQVLEPMKQEMQEEQVQKISELPLSLQPYKYRYSWLCLFIGYCMAGLLTAAFLYISDAHLLITGIMVTGVRFAAELHRNKNLLKTAHPVTRTLINTIAVAIVFGSIYWLLKIILS